MIFGKLPVEETQGAILAHSVRNGGIMFNKGRVLSAEDIAGLQGAGVKTVMVAKLQASDVGEDVAANALATALTGKHASAAAAFTGRANLFATADGLALIDRALIDRFNLTDESMTLATVIPYEPVQKGQMLATIKIIPFAAPREAFDKALALLQQTGPLVNVAPWRGRKVGLISSTLPGGKKNLLDKNLAAVSGRLANKGNSVVIERRCPHDVESVSNMIHELIDASCEALLLFGASAIVDRHDVLPHAIIAAGGEVLHVGMPVDPGNLLLLGRYGPTPVIGLPSCARSPKLNGFDWVLQRLMADVPVGAEDIMRMGAGGLLKEIASRPQPRLGRAPKPRQAPRIGALVLAAGQSSRMWPRNKLLIGVQGIPMVRRVANQIVAAGIDPCIVVTGHQAPEVRAALAGCAVTFAGNPDYAQGLSSSLRAGLRALPQDIDGVLVCLGDMPDINSQHLKKLVAAFDPLEGRAICVPTHNGKRGNPVLFGAQFFAGMMDVAGDVGARHLIGEYSDQVCEVAMDDAGVLLDLDTPQALSEYQG